MSNQADSKNTKSSTDPDKNAARSYLQRAEVRLSTMHRIAGVFINGAGLLVLFPVFFKDAILGIITVFLELQTDKTVGNVGNEWEQGDFLLLIPFILSLVIPLYALYLLLKDIVQFYFTGFTPGLADEQFIPRFALSGIAFSTDEDEALKNEALRYQYGKDVIKFILPFKAQETRYLDDAVTTTKRAIIPWTRELKRLEEQGIINKPASERGWEVTIGNTQYIVTEQKIDQFNAALGLAGVLDRKLAEEIAKSEASLVRHALLLRRLVLRYFKALLMFIWTTLISFTLLPFIDNGEYAAFVVLSIGYMCWSILAPFIVRFPIRWIYQYSTDQNINPSIRDPHLRFFERFATWACGFAFAASLVVLLTHIA